MFPLSPEVSGVKVAKELCILFKGHAVGEKGKEKMNEANKRLGGEKQAYKHYSRFSYYLRPSSFFSRFTVVQPTQIFGIFQKKKRNDVVTPFFT